MKKSKFLIYAAVAATAAIVSSCSNEDVVEQTPQKGRPIVVEASVDGSSRATVATSFTGFKLYGYDQANEGAQFLNGVGFANSGTAWTSVGAANWPTGTGACDFYAISTQGAAGVPDGIDITNLKDGSFSYTVPTDVAEQKDILVANQNDVAYADNAGKIKLGFKHALANVTMQLRFNITEGENSTATGLNDQKLYIQYITLHNVYVAGTYNSATNTWTPAETATKQNVTIRFDGGDPDTEPTLILTPGHPTTNVATDASNYQVLFDRTNSMMIMPQTLSRPTTLSDFESNETDQFIEIRCIQFTNVGAKHKVSRTETISLENETPWTELGSQYVSDFPTSISDNTDPHGCKSIYIPLSEALTTAGFGVNKTYNLRLSIANMLNNDGSKTVNVAEIAG